MQEIIIVLLFAGALAYLGNMIYRQTREDSSCSRGCCDSPAVNLKKAKEKPTLKGR